MISFTRGSYTSADFWSKTLWYCGQPKIRWIYCPPVAKPFLNLISPEAFLSPRVFVVLPVHNRVKITKSFARFLRDQTWQNWTLVLVDDGSTDGTAGEVSSILGDRVSVVRGDGNLWWAGGVNAGLSRVGELGPEASDLVLIINDDVEFGPEFVSAGVKLIADRPGSIALAKSTDSETGEVVDAGSTICWPIFKIFPVGRDSDINIAPSRGLLMTWSDLGGIGTFRADVLPHYCSDSEFTYRAWMKGFRFLTSDSFKLRMHFRETGIARIKASGVSDYLKKLFSMRSIHNPVFLSRFVLLSCPLLYRLPALLKIWISTFAKLVLFILGKAF